MPMGDLPGLPKCWFGIIGSYQYKGLALLAAAPSGFAPLPAEVGESAAGSDIIRWAHQSPPTTPTARSAKSTRKPFDLAELFDGHCDIPESWRKCRAAQALATEPSSCTYSSCVLIS